MTGQRPASARRIVELLAEHPGGLTRDALLAAVRARIPNVPAQRVAQLLGAAIGDGSITDDGSMLRATSTGPDELRDISAALRRPGPRRAVVVDVESVVRTTSVEPYTDKRIYQIGAARAGADLAWVQAAPMFRVWVELPDEDWVIRSPTVRERHAAEAVPPAEALGALMEYLREADIVAAYNGLEADFALLASACEREGLPVLGGEYVDAYYLALAVWPTAPSHRLAELAAAVGVDTSDLHWHDAGDDCVLLTRVLNAAATVLATWPLDLVDLVASVAPDSPGWLLLRELAGGGSAVGITRGHRHAEVASVAQSHLAGHTPRRAPAGAPPPGRAPLVVPDSLRGPDGRVSATLLAAAVHGNATPRTAQVEMTDALHRWADAGTGGLMEGARGARHDRRRQVGLPWPMISIRRSFEIDTQARIELLAFRLLGLRVLVRLTGLVEVWPVRVGQCVGQALTHSRVQHAWLDCLSGVKPCRGGAFLAIRLGFVNLTDGVKTHRHLLVNFPVRVGQHMTRVAVHPGQPGDSDRDTGLLSDFTDHRGRSSLSHLDAASGELPVPIIGAAHQQHPSGVIAHDRKGRGQQVLRLRRVRIMVVLHPGHGSDPWWRQHRWTTDEPLTTDKQSVNGHSGSGQPPYLAIRTLSGVSTSNRTTTRRVNPR